MASRPRPLLVAALTATALSLAATSVLAAVSKPTVTRDVKQDVDARMDLQRLRVSIGSDGTLRVAVTFASKVTPTEMLTRSGPPGSVCLRVWTATDADPKNSRADRLVCVTATSKSKLRATVLRQQGLDLPTRVSNAGVTASKTQRSFVIEFPASALGAGARQRYAVESTRPGCDVASCIDTVPDAPATRRFTLR